MIGHVRASDVGRWYWGTRRISWALRRVWLDVNLEGAENVPDHGGVLLASNHLSFLDSVLLMYALPRRVTFLGKAEYMTSPATRVLFPRAGMIPVDRSGRSIQQSLGFAGDLLDDGEIVGIFPEGTRSRDGRLHRGHTGAAHLALKGRVPIVPVGITGTDLAQPPGARVPRRGAPITLRFGAPIDPGRWVTRRLTASTKRELTDELMDAIAALSGQPRAKEYAPIPA